MIFMKKLHKNKSVGWGSKGFTLIEMLIVIAVIAILAGIVLTGVSGFQASARDTRRVGDLRNAQNFLELYFNRCGYYPGTITGGSCNQSSPDFAGLEAMMEAENFTSNFPNDPVASKTYYYGVTGPDNLGYVLGAELERENNVLNDDVDGTVNGIDCSDANLRFCVQS